MALKNTVKAIPMTTFNVANLLAFSWVPFAAPLPHACFMIRLLNRSNVPVAISYTGIGAPNSGFNDHLRADSDLVINFQRNSQPTNNFSWMKEGTRVYLMGDPLGAHGFIYLCGYYQESQ